MLIASILTSAFLIMGVSAWRMIKKVDGPETRNVMYTGIIIAAIFTPIQIFVGDLHGLNTLEHQPAKVAAIEAIWDTEEGAPLTLFGFPDETEKKTHFAIKIPKLASLILTHELNGELKGINDFKDETPPVSPVFWAFRIMVGVGTLMLIVSWWGVFTIWRKKSIGKPLLTIMSVMTFSGWVAVLSGWYDRNWAPTLYSLWCINYCRCCG